MMNQKKPVQLDGLLKVYDDERNYASVSSLAGASFLTAFFATASVASASVASASGASASVATASVASASTSAAWLVAFLAAFLLAS